MLGPARRHFVEEALGLHEPYFEERFPAGFDWGRLCADTPAMVARLEGRDPADVAREDEARMRRRARRVFRASYVTTLAALAMDDTDELDPGACLEGWLAPLSDEGEAHFAQLVGANLDALEADMGGALAPALSEEAEGIRQRAEGAWPTLAAVLEEDELLGADDEATEDDTASRRVLLATARLAVLLGAMRSLA